MSTNRLEIDEVTILNAVSAFDTALRSIQPAEVDHAELAEHIEYSSLAEKTCIESLAEWIDAASVAYELDEGSIAEQICLSDLAGEIDQSAVVKELRESLPQVEDLDVLQSRQVEMWELYTSLKQYFGSNAAAPVNADGELK